MVVHTESIRQVCPGSWRQPRLDRLPGGNGHTEGRKDRAGSPGDEGSQNPLQDFVPTGMRDSTDACDNRLTAPILTERRMCKGGTPGWPLTSYALNYLRSVGVYNRTD